MTQYWIWLQLLYQSLLTPQHSFLFKQYARTGIFSLGIWRRKECAIQEDESLRSGKVGRRLCKPQFLYHIFYKFEFVLWMNIILFCSKETLIYLWLTCSIVRPLQVGPKVSQLWSHPPLVRATVLPNVWEHLMVVDVLTGQDTAPRRTAHGRGHKGVGELRPSASKVEASFVHSSHGT